MKTTFARKVADLIDAGMSCKRIATLAGCDPSTIYRLKVGDIEEPRYSVGKLIDELHAGLPVNAANAIDPQGA